MHDRLTTSILAASLRCVVRIRLATDQVLHRPAVCTWALSLVTLSLSACIAYDDAYYIDYPPPPTGPVAAVSFPALRTEWNFGTIGGGIAYAVKGPGGCGILRGNARPDDASNYITLQMPAERQVFISINRRYDNLVCRLNGSVTLAAKQSYTFEVREDGNLCFGSLLRRRADGSIVRTPLRPAYMARREPSAGQPNRICDFPDQLTKQ